MNIIDTLSIEEQKLLTIKDTSKNEIIFRENDLCNEIGIVLEGVISISSYSYEGKEMIYNSLTKNMIFGNNLIFSDEPYFKGNVISKTKSKIAFINKINLIKLIQSNQTFLIKYLSIQSNFGKQLNSRIKLISFDKALDRFDYYLFINNGQIRFHSIKELSEMLNLTREATSRLISSQIKAGKITRDKNIIKKI